MIRISGRAFGWISLINLLPRTRDGLHSRTWKEDTKRRSIKACIIMHMENFSKIKLKMYPRLQRKENLYWLKEINQRWRKKICLSRIIWNWLILQLKNDQSKTMNFWIHLTLINLPRSKRSLNSYELNSSWMSNKLTHQHLKILINHFHHTQKILKITIRESLEDRI